MNSPRALVRSLSWLIAGWLIGTSGIQAQVAAPPVQSGTTSLTLDLDKPGVPVSPTFFGLMTEEINHSYDGGLYAELIQNRTFQDDPAAPVHWSLVEDGGASASIALDKTTHPNDVLPVSLKLQVTSPGKRAGVANDGFWGIPVKPQTTYHASFYARTEGSGGTFSVSIESPDGATTFAHADIPSVAGDWRQYTATLTTPSDAQVTANARFVISTTSAQTVWLNLVSLFPPTYHDRPNGNRIDIMELLAGMHPKFLRCPGGNYVEGDWFKTRFAWEKTIGPLDQRPGHESCWNYRSSDGMGLLEFMEWCEELKIQPVLAVFAGYTLKGDNVDSGPALQGFVNEALDELEYVTGDTSTKWGAQRAKDGHPAPFPLTYVEIGNEDAVDKAKTYDARFAAFYDAIKAKYPNLQLIATMRIKSRVPDLVDDHYYRSIGQMEGDATHYDAYPRTGPKIFVGEWATLDGSSRHGEPTPNLAFALSDAAWLTGLERNSDVVLIQSYAPLFVNINPGAHQWAPDLIGYNATSSYGSPSYYVERMFSTHLGDRVIPISAENVPMQPYPSPRSGVPNAPIPAVYYVATRDTKSGTIYLKMVNAVGTPQSIDITLNGSGQVDPSGTAITLSSDNPKDTNSITAPTKCVPVETKVDGLGKHFTRTLAPWSVNVLQIGTH